MAFALFSYAIASPVLKQDVAPTVFPTPVSIPVPTHPPRPTLTDADMVYPSPNAVLPEESFAPLAISADEDEFEAMEVSAEPSAAPLPLLPADWPEMPKHLSLFDPESQDPIEKLCHMQGDEKCCEHRFPCACTSKYAKPCGKSHACEDSGTCHCLKLVCLPLADDDDR